VGGLESARFVVSLLDSPKEDLFLSILLVATLCNPSCYFVLKNYFFLRLSLSMWNTWVHLNVRTMNWCCVKKCFVWLKSLKFPQLPLFYG
jgi:hypothetical protein